jgi:hypothetical protein
LSLAGGKAPVTIALDIVLVSCWGQGARHHSVGRKQEDDERIGATTEEFVGTEGDTVTLLDTPSRVGGCSTTRNDAGFDSCADKARFRYRGR